MVMHTRIFLIGFMGSGKTTLGRKLARQLHYAFVDMDALIEETAGQSVPEIFKEHGEKVFRKWERDILLELGSGSKLIVATGGGAPCHGDMMNLMNASGCTVYIKMSPTALHHRLLRSKTERPLIKGKSHAELLEFIGELLEKRSPYYEQARYIVDGENIHPDVLVNILEEHS
jgi:shikimate kinase